MRERFGTFITFVEAVVLDAQINHLRILDTIVIFKGSINLTLVQRLAVRCRVDRKHVVVKAQKFQIPIPDAWLLVPIDSIKVVEVEVEEA